MKRPFFSIIIPTHNRATDLEFALFCILRQSFRDFEIIISDNSSTDNTRAVVQTFRDKRIRYSKTKRMLWNSANVARAVKQAKGMYIFIHSDDDFLPYKTSFQYIYQEISKHKSGYLRLNYLSMSLDRKHIFAYRLNKQFIQNTYFVKGQNNAQILRFIRDTDPYFMSGIVLKNTFPKGVSVVDCDPAPWIDMLFYDTYAHGGCFIVQPQMVAQWSRRKIPKNQVHHIFSLIQGKLRSEGYLNAIRRKVDPMEYRKFLCKELYVLYVDNFPMVKAKVGNTGLLQLSARILQVAPELKKRVSYWALLILAICVPEICWIFARWVYLGLYARTSRPYNYKALLATLSKLELEFINTKKTSRQTVNRVFSF